MIWISNHFLIWFSKIYFWLNFSMIHFSTIWWIKINDRFKCYQKYVVFSIPPAEKPNRFKISVFQYFYGAMQKICHSEKSKFHTPSQSDKWFISHSKMAVFQTTSPLWRVTYFLHCPYGEFGKHAWSTQLLFLLVAD